MKNHIYLTTCGLCIVFLILLCGSSRAEENADVPYEKLAGELWNEIAPDKGIIRPPYELARNDLSLSTKKETTLDQLHEDAIKRQIALEQKWTALKAKREGVNLSESAAHQTVLLEYAYGERSLEDALAASKKVGNAERLKFARLLLAECNFSTAVSELIELANANDVTADNALAILVRHDVERDELSKRITLMPLSVDLKAFLNEHGAKADKAALIAALRKSVNPAFAHNAPPALEKFEDIVNDVFIGEETTDIVVIGRRQIERQIAEGSLASAYLQTDSNDLILFRDRDAESVVTAGTATINIHSAYHGPLTFKLYYFDNRESCEKAGPLQLKNMTPRTWTAEIRPLRENNLLAKVDTTVEVDVPKSGYYLLTAEARYAPQVAGYKFTVSNVALYLHVANNMAVVAAVDRNSGQPVANQRVQLKVTGSPNFYSLQSSHTGDSNAFAAGFNGSESAFSPTATADATLAYARSYAEGQQARKKFPDLNSTPELVTKEDGTAALPLSLGAGNYSYSLTATAVGLHAEARLNYTNYGQQESIKAVAWCAQPVYRPGESANFKGILRRFTGTKILDHQREWKSSVQVEIKNTEGAIWKGRCAVSDAGTFNAQFKVPVSAYGAYWIDVDGQTANPHDFLRVEEFRLPTYSVKVKPNAPGYRSGSRVNGTVEVIYPGGRPASGVEVEVSLEDGTQNPPAKLVTTNSAGQAQFDFETKPHATNQHFTLRATASDASNQSFSDATYVSLHAAPFEVSLDFESSPVQGKPYSINVTAKSWNGSPLVGASVILKGSFNVLKTDENGRVTIPCTAPSDKNEEPIQVTVVSGNETTFEERTARFARPFDENSTAVGNRRGNSSQLELEAGDVKAGDDLKVTISLQNARETNNFVLLFLQNTDICDYRVLRMNEGSHQLSMPTSPAYGPSATLEAVLLTGRQKYRSSRPVRITPVQKFLTIDVSTDRAEYKPGDLCKVELHAKDYQGKPAGRVELSLGVVHGSTYLLHEDPTPSLQNYFYNYSMPDLARNAFENGSPLQYALLYWNGPKYAWGYLTEDPFGIGQDYGSGHGSFGQRNGGGRRLMVKRHGGSRATERSVRQDFRNTAYWVAELLTDADGVARTEFTFPDDITDWRFTARGITPDTLVGEVRLNRTTTLPLQVELAMPRGLRAGDRVEAGAVVHNNAGPDRKVDVKYSGGEKDGQSSLDVKLGGVARAPFWIAPSAAGTLKLDASVVDNGHSQKDALVRQLDVLPGGYRIQKQTAGSLDKNTEILLNPEGATSTRLQISIEAGPAAAIESALNSLIEYPYGCVEQTMSRFMPAVVASQAMKRTGLKSSKEDILPDVVAKGLVRLQNFQHPDGGWGWWEHDQTNDFMTAYVLDGLLVCRDSGLAVPALTVQRASTYLASKMFEDKLEGRHVSSIGAANLNCYVAKVLAHAFARDVSNDAEVHRQRLHTTFAEYLLNKELSARDHALTAQAFQFLKNETMAQQHLDAAFEAKAAEDMRAQTLAKCSILEALATIAPNDPRNIALTHSVLRARKGTVWQDTLATANAVRALAATLKDIKHDSVPVEVLIDGKVAGLIEPDANGRGQILLSDVKNAKNAMLRARGASSNFWSAQVETYVSTPPPAPENAVAGIAISVATRDGTALPVENGVVKVKRGQTLKLTLECELKSSLVCARLTLPRPCGVELVRGAKLQQGLVSYEERDTSFNYFIDHWDAGTHTVELLVRAENAGNIFAPLAELEPMYGDSIPVSIKAPVRWEVTE